MESLFLTLCNMSITAGWLVLAVIVLRLLLKKAPKAITVVMWALVGIRLICPFSFESSLSLIPSAETIPTNIIYADAPAIQSGLSALNVAVNPILSNALAPAEGDGAHPMQVIAFVACVIWITGMAAMLSYTVMSYFHVYKKVREAAPLRDHIWLCDRIDTPFIFGVIRPRIFLPSAMSEQDMGYVIAHENAHLKRHDHWWKPLGFLLLTVYWFNPMIWIAYMLLCRDIELACDEKVIEALGAESKKPYSDVLLNCSVPRRRIAACPLAFGEIGVKARIKSVLNYKRPAFWAVIIAMIACIAVSVGFLTNPITNNAVDERLSAFIDQEIAEYHDSKHSDAFYRTLDFEVLGTEKSGLERTVYMWVLYQEYSYDYGLKVESGVHIPTVITAKRANGYYELVEYWQPGDGARYTGDIKEKFPLHLQRKALDSQRYIAAQQAKCEEKANALMALFAKVQYGGEKIVYDCGSYSSLLFTDDSMPQFSFSQSDGHLLTSDYPYPSAQSAWYDIGALQKFDLNQSNFDDLLTSEIWDDGFSAKSLREKNRNAYFVAEEAYNRFYYLLEQKNGELYIAYGYPDTNHIRWIFKMKN